MATPLFIRLASQAEAAGVSLNQACRDAGIDRSILERWKKREPKTITILRALEEAIAKATAEMREAEERFEQAVEAETEEATEDKWV